MKFQKIVKKLIECKIMNKFKNKKKCKKIRIDFV